MRYELNDHEWSAIKPMLPNKPRGVPRVSDRRVLNAIIWVFRYGAMLKRVAIGVVSVGVVTTIVVLQPDAAVRLPDRRVHLPLLVSRKISRDPSGREAAPVQY